MKKSIAHTLSLYVALTFAIPLLAKAQQPVNWQRSNANLSGDVHHIAYGYDGYYYGIGDSGIIASGDQGATWRPLASRPDMERSERLTAVTITTDNLLIVGTEDSKASTGTLYASTDQGESWHYISGIGGEQTIRSLLTTPNGDVYLATYSNDSSYAIYQLPYGATSWLPIYRWTPEFPADVNTLTSDVNGFLYMMSSYGVTVSYDQGESWYKITPKADDPYESDKVKSTDSMVTSEINDLGNERSKNAGYARTESVSNFTTQHVTSLAVNSVGHIFAGTEFGGVYRSTNKGASWQQVTSGLTNNAVHSLIMTPGDTLFAGSFGMVFRSAYPTADIKEVAGYNAKGSFVESISPNPAKNRLTIRYKLDKPSQVSIAVFDGKGRKIKQLVDETKVSGMYELNSDIAGLPPGRYDIQLVAEDGFDMKPFVITR